MVNRFECVLTTIQHEEPPVVPQIIDFTNEMSRSKFISIINEKAEKTEKVTKKLFYSTKNNVSLKFYKILKEAELLDNFIVHVGSGGFQVTNRVKADFERFLDKWETGAVWRVGTSKTTWVREYIKYPVEREEDLEKLVFPDPDDPERYLDIEKSIEYVQDKGFFPTCSINGFFSGLWYFVRGPLEVVLRDIYHNRRLFENLMAKIGEFNLKAEKNLLERGALMITWVDDLGYNKGTFMNPNVYKELIFPWHKKAIELAHKYGAFVNMHSHGNINAIVPFLVDAKLDVLNPIGPSDNMNLAFLKEKFGDKLCLQGGLSKHIGFMNLSELKEHIIDRLRIGSPGGGYILSSEGSIPYEMSVNNFLAFLKISRKYRRTKHF
ncbi:MAG: uroporphyrinogen decarboxylase family protein [Candidatus Bathyarchaeia archaeon]